MNLILQSRDHYKEVAILDPSTGTVTIVNKDEILDFDFSNINGFFSEVAGRKIYFYGNGKVLFVRIGDRTIEITNDVTMQIQQKGTDNVVAIRRCDEVLFDWQYPKVEIEPPLEMYQFFNPLMDEENFDIMLFIHRIIASPDKERLIHRWAPSRS